MPPKAKITKDMIINAAFKIVRKSGVENLNTRSISKILNCSTQPILYHFATIVEIKNETYQKADSYHTAYITAIQEDCANPMLEIGLLYIRFAATEKELFRFLFQSNKFDNNNFNDLVDNENLQPILKFLECESGLSNAQTKEIFISIFLVAHGFASMLANNAMNYDEAFAIRLLKNTFSGVLTVMKEDKT